MPGCLGGSISCLGSSSQVGVVNDHSFWGVGPHSQIPKSYLAYVLGHRYFRPRSRHTPLQQTLDYLRDQYKKGAWPGLKPTHMKSLLKGLCYLFEFDCNNDGTASLLPDFLNEYPKLYDDVVSSLDQMAVHLRNRLAQKSSLNQDNHIQSNKTSPKKRLQHHSRPHAAEVRERAMTQLQAVLPQHLADNAIFIKLLKIAIEFHDLEQEDTVVDSFEYDTNEQATVALLLEALQNNVIQPIRSAYHSDASVKQWLNDFRQTAKWLMDYIIEIGTTPLFPPFDQIERVGVYDVGGRLLEVLTDNQKSLKRYCQMIQQNDLLRSVYMAMIAMGNNDKCPIASAPQVANYELNNPHINALYPKQDPLWQQWFASHCYAYINKDTIVSQGLNPNINQHVFFTAIASNIAMSIELASSTQQQAANQLMGCIEYSRCGEYITDDMTLPLQTLLFNDQAIQGEERFSRGQKVNLQSSERVFEKLFPEYTTVWDIRPEMAQIHGDNLIEFYQYFNSLSEKDQQQLANSLIRTVALEQTGEIFCQLDDQDDETNFLKIRPPYIFDETNSSQFRPDRSNSRTYSGSPTKEKGFNFNEDSNAATPNGKMHPAAQFFPQTRQGHRQKRSWSEPYVYTDKELQTKEHPSAKCNYF